MDNMYCIQAEKDIAHFRSMALCLRFQPGYCQPKVARRQGVRFDLAVPPSMCDKNTLDVA